MTVTYEPNTGRIRVEDPHDALLLSLAGVELYRQCCDDDTPARYRFDGLGWWFEDEPGKFVPLNVSHDGFPECLYVPADVAETISEIVGCKAIWVWQSCQGMHYSADSVLVRANNRWHILPDIKMETGA